MHTVVFGWFGISAVWFLPLAWRLFSAFRPGGSGSRGSIRLGLGFLAVLVSSCTLATALPGGDTSDGLGHLLAGGFERLFGHIGTPFVMAALFVFGLPWLFGLEWRRVNTWLDAAFGLRLGAGGERERDESRGVADLPRSALHRDEDRRVRRASDVQPSAANTVNSMAPKHNGRFAKPTLWRPDTKHPGPRDGTRRAGAAPAPSPVEPSAPPGWLSHGARDGQRAPGMPNKAPGAPLQPPLQSVRPVIEPPTPAPFVPSSVTVPPASPSVASSAVQAAQAVKALQERYPSTRRPAPTVTPIRPVVPPIAQAQPSPRPVPPAAPRPPTERDRRRPRAHRSIPGPRSRHSASRLRPRCRTRCARSTLVS
ncbi:MAG: hypothetical protein GAK40_00986 [Burkholderia plantarii]|nr:MAG: hypothetical protein GAK40_00986 [Burkholderia plantarii]